MKLLEDLLTKPAVRRAVILILLILLIIVILLLISKCTADISVGTGGDKVTDNYIGVDGSIGGETDPPETEDSADTEESGETASPETEDEDKDPVETEKEEPSETDWRFEEGDSSESEPTDTSIILRPFFPDQGTDLFEAHQMLPGAEDTAVYAIENKHSKDRKLYFSIDITKDVTNNPAAKMADVLLIDIEYGDDTYSYCFSDFESMKDRRLYLGTIAAKSTQKCTVTVQMSADANNDYINSTLTAKFRWTAE